MKTGLAVTTPASAEGLLRGENLVWDESFRADSLGGQGAWSTRIGYEPYFPSGGYVPFSSLGRMDSLHVWQPAPSLYFVLFEAGGVLYLLHDFGGSTPTLITLASNRFIPTALTPASQYTPVGDGVLVTNGYDTPLLVQPWPLPGIAVAQSAAAQVVRPFGMQTAPTAAPLGLAPIDATGTGPASTIAPTTGGAVSLWWSNSGTALGYPNIAGIGYGTTPADEAKPNAYSYKVSFVSDLGGEGPLSEATVLSWESPENQRLGARHVPGVVIPVGPAGTVARKLWRSQNWAEGLSSEGDDTLYLAMVIPNNVDEVVFDYTRTPALGAGEPALGSRIELPLRAPLFAATYLGRLWIAGSPADPYTVYYSRPQSPEWFSLGDYVPLPLIGGQITGLFAHYTLLLVFRERSLDIIDTDLRATTLLGGVDCAAPHSAVGTPYGVVFAARDGLYLVSGGTVGGATAAVTKLSNNPAISEVWARAVAPCGPLLVRAVGTWSSLRNEYWLQVPVNGADRPNLGIVWHAPVPGGASTGTFSLRVGWPVGCFATLPNGETVFGHNEGHSGQGPQQPAGIFVVSQVRALGLKLEGDVYVPGDPPKSVYRSPYFDFGDMAQLKTITYVTLYLVTTGNVKVELQTAINGTGPYTASSDPLFSQPSPGPLLPVYGTSTTDPFDSGATLPLTQVLLDTYNSSLGMVVPVRFSVGEQRCNTFSFEFVTTDDVVLAGFRIEGNVAAEPMRGPGGQR